MDSDYANTIKNAQLSDIIGQEAVKDDLKSALLMDRHLILVGPPGAGKTTLVKNLAKHLPAIKAASCGYHCSPGKPLCPECQKEQKNFAQIDGIHRFIRVQGSPDLTAEDLLGDIDPAKALQFGPMSIEAFTPGKLFKANNGILFFDEINRCNEKLQNALLQVLEEGTITIGSYDVDFPTNIIFIGTMNPDDNSTQPLSDVFMDRFDLVRMDYPATQAQEEEIVRTVAKQFVSVPNHLLQDAVMFVRGLRDDEKLEKVPSVRASLGLVERAQSNAFLAGREEVSPEDLGKAIESVIAHRIRLKPSAGFLMTPEVFVKERFEEYQTVKGGGP